MWYFYSCGTFTYVGLLPMWYFYLCGTFTHVVLLLMRYFYSYGTFTHVLLLLMCYFYSCGTFTYVVIYSYGIFSPVVLLLMWYFYLCDIFTHVILYTLCYTTVIIISSEAIYPLQYVRNTAISGNQYQWQAICSIPCSGTFEPGSFTITLNLDTICTEFTVKKLTT